MQVVNAVLVFKSRGSMAYPGLQITRTESEKFAFVVFKAAFEIFSGGHIITAKHRYKV